jgi:hypothetical protein
MIYKLNAQVVCIAVVLIVGASATSLSAEPQQSAPTPHIYSVREIKGMFPRPKTVEQLLRNLKLAYERNLLVQPGFLDQNVLKQFFNGTAIHDSESRAILELDRHFFPGMSVRVDHAYFPIAGHNAAAPPHEYVPGYAETLNYLEINMTSAVMISVRQIKDIFGGEFQEHFDLGEASDGHAVVPTTKGSLQYSQWIRRPGPEEFDSRDALFVVKKELVEGPRCIPSILRNRCGLKDDDVIERISLSGKSTVH